jgi:hypothetical protein
VQNGRWTGRCPFPDHDDHTPSYTVNVGRDGRVRYCCWSRCGSGDALDFVKKVHGLNTAEAIAWLRNYCGIPEPERRTAPRRKPSPQPQVRTFHPVEDHDARLPATHATRHLERYCDARGWPMEVAELHGLEVVQHHGRPWVRHPYRTPGADGSALMWSFQDRVLPLDSEHTPRWWTPAGQPLPLFGLEHLEETNALTVYVTEGAADAITARWVLSHYPDVDAAVLGVPGTQAWSAKWRPILQGRTVVLATDPDVAGQQLADRIASDLDGYATAVLRVDPTWMQGDLTDTLANDTGNGVHVLAAALLEPLHLHQTSVGGASRG